MTNGRPFALRGCFIWCDTDPLQNPTALRRLDDGLMLIEDGRIRALDHAEALVSRVCDEHIPVHDWRGHVLLPGLIDAHTHSAQLDVIATSRGPLLEWLEQVVFPNEADCADHDHAIQVADNFLDTLIAHGTTCAGILSTVHPDACRALFAAADARGMALVAGKVLMDCNAPPALREPVDDALDALVALRNEWHGRKRQRLAICPRFALSCSEPLLTAAGRLRAHHDDLLLHTHLAENRLEVAAVARRFPDTRSYLDAYDRAGLVGRNSLFAHAVHIDDVDRARMAQAGASIAFCPSANLFLGSGLFDHRAARDAGINIALGTDIGAGMSPGLMPTLADACKVLSLRGERMGGAEALYMVTLAGARALQVPDAGRFATGLTADLIAIDPDSDPTLSRRVARAVDTDDLLFALLTLGSAAAIRETWIAGVPRKRPPAAATSTPGQPTAG